MSVAMPIVRWWGRLETTGTDLLIGHGALLLVGNHDSHWDPLVVGVAAGRRRQIRALAKSSLWQTRPLARVLDGMGQLRITRGVVDRAELTAIGRVLKTGGCVGIFPEGGLSQGHKVRAHSGAGWLARTGPDVKVVAVAISGAVDIVRFPRRPRITVTFFAPIGGAPGADESSVGFSRRVMAEIRDRAPAVPCGRSIRESR